MIMISTIIPIAILAVFGLLFAISFKVGKKYMTIKVTHWLLMIYMAVLLVAMVFVAIMDENKLFPETTEEKGIDQRSTELRTKLSRGEFDQVDPVLLMKEVSVEHEENLPLTIYSQAEFGTQIYVERKPENDSQIEAFVYTSGININGMDFTDLLEPYQLAFSKETLTIRPSRQEINLSFANNSFPIRQFTGEKMFQHSYTGGVQMLYLRVPKDLEIRTATSGNVQLEYIDH